MKQTTTCNNNHESWTGDWWHCLWEVTWGHSVLTPSCLSLVSFPYEKEYMYVQTYVLYVILKQCFILLNQWSNSNVRPKMASFGLIGAYFYEIWVQYGNHGAVNKHECDAFIHCRARFLRWTILIIMYPVLYETKNKWLYCSRGVIEYNSLLLL